MQIPLEVSFIGIEHSEAADALIREKAADLEQNYPGIVSCRVTVEAPHRRHRKGNLYGVGIEVRLPGHTIAVTPHQGDAASHEHLAVAARHAFAIMARRLNETKRVMRGDVKAHEGMLQGEVAQIDHERGFGQILATDHRLVYFHKNSVVDGDFDKLQPRDPVELVVQIDESDVGPQASTVRPIRRMQFNPG